MQGSGLQQELLSTKIDTSAQLAISKSREQVTCRLQRMYMAAVLQTYMQDSHMSGYREITAERCMAS